MAGSAYSDTASGSRRSTAFTRREGVGFDWTTRSAPPVRFRYAASAVTEAADSFVSTAHASRFASTASTSVPGWSTVESPSSTS
ncbi:hypothetical protein ACFQRB_15525 [Halobaculum litoreum]|uniref:Uncharacterized protein n=1 Tax=Halobaculum litoreum TaxID=3031998 RepID=A0ABD5XVD8_9EURY